MHHTNDAPGMHARAPDVALTGPLPDRFEISLYAAPARPTITPTPLTTTWPEFVERCSTHRRRLTKDGAGFSGAKLKPGTTRANVNVEAVSILLFDLDKITSDTYAEVRDLLLDHGLAFCAYSTFSSNDEKLCVRFALPATTPVPSERYPAVWRSIDHVLFGGRLDPQTKDVSRMTYEPAALPDALVFAEHYDGLALDWTKLPAAPTTKATTNGATSAGQDVGISRQTLEFLVLGAPVGQQRGAALRAIRALLAAGKSNEETTDKVFQGLQASEVGDPAKPWTYEYVLEMVEDLASREPTPLERLPELKLNGHIRINGRTKGEEKDSAAFLSASTKVEVAAERNGAVSAADPTRPPIDAASAADDSVKKVSARTSTLVEAERKTIFRTARQIGAETPATPPWVVPGYVAQTVITELDGKLKASGKTTWIMAMIAAIVEGKPFLGRPTSRTGVVILTEQNSASLRQALARANLLDRDDVVILAWYDVRALPWPIVVELAAEEARRLGYSVLIVDTLGQFSGITGDGENSSGAALEAMKPLQEVAAEGLAVLVSRHERKGGGDVGEAGRGSSAFSGAVDMVLSLRRPDGQQRETVRVLHALSRFDETPSELVIELVDGEYVALGSGEDVKRQEARGAVLDHLPTEEADAIDMKALLEALADLKIRRTILQATIEEHLASGVVSRTGNGKRGDPYRYWMSQGNNSAGTTGAAAESNEPTPDDTIGCGVMPVESEGDECGEGGGES